MADWLESFVLTFVPLFVVMDVVGCLPFFITMSEESSTTERHKIIHISTLTAFIVGLAFLLFGNFILSVLSISVGSFSIAGGLILLILSIKYLLTGRFVEAVKDKMIAVVPIGTPLLAGPATITTLLLLSGQHPLYIVLISFVINLFIVWTVFRVGTTIIRLLGQSGLKAISNVFNLLLAAIAVAMIIRGLGLEGIITLGA